MLNFILAPLNISSTTDFILILVFSVISTILMIFVGYKLMQMLQLAGYKMKGYFRWFKETNYSYFSRLSMLSFLSISSMMIVNVLLEDFFNELKFGGIFFVGIIFFILFSSLFITNLFTAKQKTPLKYTKRMNRFIVTYSILTLVITFSTLYIGYRWIPYLGYALVGIVPILLPIIVIVSFYINLPFERNLANSYIKKAKKKLKDCKKLRVVGITGSYGKTTVKNILAKILEEKFRVCATPSSYNTPLGLAKTILQNLKLNDEIFIAEMGAKQNNDIRELCEIVSPEIGVITGIGNQHLLTFGSIENIIKTKGELADFLIEKKGKIFINADSENAKQLSKKYVNATTSTLKEKGKIFIQNIETNSSGSTFELVSGKNKEKCSTVLLGKHNISNILLCANVALELGLNLKQISSGISKLSTTPHRLEIIKSSSTYTIIDDAYNSSVEGSSASLDVLSKFDGKKFVITPGLVELGDEQFKSNFDFGVKMAKICDYVIIDCMINFKAISEGLISAGFDKEKIIQATNLTQAVAFLNSFAGSQDVVLFENDLPDNYS